ncbi:MAG: endoglycosylceramidase [Thermoleophilaceae bacterium]|nr:endoglycosylceramidase [Thermoleophilaceae bacterium]
MRWIALLGVLAAAIFASPADAIPRLHAERGESPAVATSDGRQVLLRGVNVNQLGDYWQQRSDIPATFPLTEEDFAGIQALGMNGVRLIVHWSKLEPARGQFDGAYLSRIREAVGWAREHGIYVVLDMHQDAWGKAIASPKDEPCAPGFSHQQGWDGAPAWATLTDGLPTCRLQIREIAPAVGQAWQSFYLDRDGIQSELVKTWAYLARAFAAEPAVAGYDLLNEPNTGYGPGAEDATTLGLFYRRAIDAIRTAERSAREGFSHIVFFEPSVIWSAAAIDATPPPPLVEDPNSVFSPHLYAESISADRAVGTDVLTVEQGFEFADLIARQYGTTVWSGEWGWFGDPEGDEPAITRYAAQEDAHLWGGAWWDWKQSCGDPHMFGDGDSTQPGSESPSLNRFRCPGNEPLGIPPTTGRVLARPYVRMAPGRIASMTSDPAKRTLVASGAGPDAGGSCRIEAWFPGTAPTVEAAGIKHVRVTRLAGGWIVSGCARAGWRLQLAPHD